MAEDIGALYIRLGLSLSELETDFVTASQTVAQNISRLNREADLVRIRSQVEIAGLDEAADAERILQVRADALNRQMQIQRDRVRILDAELQNLTQTQGANSIATQRATIRLERERLTLARLERDVRDVTAAITELNSTDVNVSGSASISGGAGGTGGSSGGGGGTGSSWTDLLPFEFPTTKMEAFAAAIGAVGLAVGTTTQIIQDTLEDFRETEKQAYELNLDFNDAEQFLRELKLGGGDIGDFEGYIRGISDAFVKGEYDDPEFIALRKYGAEITDATGRLKNFKDFTDEVYEAWKKADEAGEGIEFLQLTGGEAGVRDAIQFFKRMEEAKEDAEKIVDANLDDREWHEVERSINLATEQTDEFTEAIANIFTPAVQSSAESFFNILREGTEWLIENKEELQSWGFVAKELFGELKVAFPKVESFFPSGQLSTALESFDKFFSSLSRGNEKANEEFYKNSLIGNISDLFEDNPFSRAVDRAKEKQKEYNGELEETKTVTDAVERGLEALTEAQKKNGNVLNQYGLTRIKRFKDELEDLKIESEFGDNDYAKSIAQLDLRKKRELNDKNFVSIEERLAIEELYAAKLEQIEEEKEQKLAEIRQQITAGEQTELEKRIAAIEHEKQTWIQAGMEKTEAEQLAQKQFSDYLKNTRQELSDKVQSLYQTELENRLAQIEQEKQAWIDKCADEVKATELAEQQKADAQRATAMNVLRKQSEEYEAYQKGGYAGLRAYKASELERQGVNSDYLYMTPQQLANFQKASQVADKSMMPNFMTDYDRYEHQQQMQNWRDWRQEQGADYDKQNYVIIDGIKIGISEALGNFGREFNIGKNNREESHSISVSPEGDRYTRQDDRYSYNNDSRLSQRDTLTRERTLPIIPEPLQQYDNTFSGLSESLQGISASFSEMPTAVQGITESLGELSTTVQEVAEQIANIPEIEPTEIPEIDSTGIAEVVQSFSEMPTAVQSATESLGELSTTVQGVMEQISAIEPQQLSQDTELPSVLSEVTQSFSQLPTVIQSASDSLNQLPITVSGLGESLTTQISQLFSPMSESLTTVTVKIGDISTGIENVSSALNTFISALNKKINQLNTTPNVTNTISIEEAHAWDYDHIQELAEKVADIIEPIIIRAVGGDSSSY